MNDQQQRWQAFDAGGVGMISRRTVELMPQTEVLIIPEVNHAPPLQDPDAVARAIASFVHSNPVHV
jgi:pimeloyl-ACP methyl ester carboxylesterase